MGVGAEVNDFSVTGPTAALVRTSVGYPAFVPVTRTEMKAPTSELTRVYVRPVAPPIGEPLRNHWMLRFTGAGPQVPVTTVSVFRAPGCRRSSALIR